MNAKTHFGLHLIDCCNTKDICAHARELGRFDTYAEAIQAAREWPRDSWLQISVDDADGVVCGAVTDVVR